MADKNLYLDNRSRTSEAMHSCLECGHNSLENDMKPETNQHETGSGCPATPCSLTAFLSLAFIGASILSVVSIVGLAVWLPIEIQRGGEIIKERNDLYFKP